MLWPQAIDANKLFHIDLNGRNRAAQIRIYRFGKERSKSRFFLVKLLEDSGYKGMLHFDAHAFRTEDEAGVWDFAAGCMRTYLGSREGPTGERRPERSRRYLRPTAPTRTAWALFAGVQSANLKSIRELHGGSTVAYGKKGYRYEKLDQLTIDLLLGLR